MYLKTNRLFFFKPPYSLETKSCIFFSFPSMQATVLIALLFAWNEAVASGGNTLTITSRTCYITNGEACEFNIRWKTQKKGDYCVISVGRNGPSYCWTKAVSGKTTIHISELGEHKYALVSMASHNPLDTSTIKALPGKPRWRRIIPW